MVKREVKSVFVDSLLSLGLIFGALLLTRCGGAPVKPGGLEEIKAPQWVIKGSGAFESEKGKVFYGVGSASGIRNFSLARTTADNRARNELAKVFEVYVVSLMKDYAASTTAGDFGKSSEEQHVEQAIKTVVASTLNGSEIIDHWEHPRRNELFSLARLDLAAFRDLISQAKELNAGVRDYIRQNASKLHQELAKEEAKRK